MGDIQGEIAHATPNGVRGSLDRETSISAWYVVRLYLSSSCLGYVARKMFISMIQLPGVDVDVINGCAALIGIVVVTCFVLRTHPDMARRLSFKFDFRFLPFAVGLGLFAGNASFAIQTHWGEIGFFKPNVWLVVLTVLVVPVVEEIFCRGVILQSLLHRHPIVLSVLLSTILIAIDHSAFWPALVGQIMLSIVYLGSRRSLTMSIIAHAVSNLATGFPSDMLRYTHYIKGL